MQIGVDSFAHELKRINLNLTNFWPCKLCFYFGYICCPCTGGLSLFCPNICISDVSGFRDCLSPAYPHLP